MGTLDNGWPTGSGACEIAVAWQADLRTLGVRRVPGQTGEHTYIGYPRFHRHFSTGASPSTGCALCPSHCPRLWTTSCTQLGTGLLSALPDLLSTARMRRAAGIRLCTPCGFDVDFEWRPRRGHGHAGMWTTADPARPAAIDVDKQIAVKPSGPRRRRRAGPWTEWTSARYGQGVGELPERERPLPAACLAQHDPALRTDERHRGPRRPHRFRQRCPGK